MAAPTASNAHALLAARKAAGERLWARLLAPLTEDAETTAEPAAAERAITAQR